MRIAAVPKGDYTVPLGKARVWQTGKDVTVVGYGAQMRVLQTAVNRAQQELGVSCELIDLRTIMPWDVGAFVHFLVSQQLVVCFLLVFVLTVTRVQSVLWSPSRRRAA